MYPEPTPNKAWLDSTFGHEFILKINHLLSVCNDLNSTRTSHTFHFLLKIKFKLQIMSCFNGRHQWETVLILVTSITARILGARGNTEPFNLLMAIETQGWLNNLRKIDCGAEEEHFDRDHVVDSKLHLSGAWVIERSHVRACRKAKQEQTEPEQSVTRNLQLLTCLFSVWLMCVLFKI